MQDKINSGDISTLLQSHHYTNSIKQKKDFGPFIQQMILSDVVLDHCNSSPVINKACDIRCACSNAYGQAKSKKS